MSMAVQMQEKYMYHIVKLLCLTFDAVHTVCVKTSLDSNTFFASQPQTCCHCQFILGEHYINYAI